MHYINLEISGRVLNGNNGFISFKLHPVETEGLLLLGPQAFRKGKYNSTIYTAN